jgi:hypothetical protein
MKVQIKMQIIFSIGNLVLANSNDRDDVLEGGRRHSSDGLEHSPHRLASLYVPRFG